MHQRLEIAKRAPERRYCSVDNEVIRIRPPRGVVTEVVCSGCSVMTRQGANQTPAPAATTTAIGTVGTGSTSGLASVTTVTTPRGVPDSSIS